MKNLFSLLVLLALQWYQQPISASSMQPMLIATTQQPTSLPINPEDYLPHEEHNLLMTQIQINNAEQQERQSLTCFQKCYTTHNDPFCCNTCKLKDTVRYQGGYCGSCIETTAVCSFLCIPACFVCLACCGSL